MINNHGGMTGMLNSSIIIAGIPVPWHRVLRVRPQVYISIFTISVWNLGFEGAFLFTHWSNHHTFIIFHMCSKLLNGDKMGICFRWNGPSKISKEHRHQYICGKGGNIRRELPWMKRVHWVDHGEHFLSLSMSVSHGEIMVKSCKIQYLMFLLFSHVSLFFVGLISVIYVRPSNHWRIIINYRSEICLEMELYMILSV